MYRFSTSSLHGRRILSPLRKVKFTDVVSKCLVTTSSRSIVCPFSETIFIKSSPVLPGCVRLHPETQTGIRSRRKFPRESIPTMEPIHSFRNFIRHLRLPSGLQSLYTNVMQHSRPPRVLKAWVQLFARLVISRMRSRTPNPNSLLAV